MSIENGLNASTATLLMDPVNREQELEKEVVKLKGELDESNLKKINLEDQVIELRAKLISKQEVEEELKQQLKVLSEFAINNGAQKTVDLQRMYDQMVYKDGRIVELNNVILEKERMILDLQEMCREQSQVANAKSLAVQIVNKRLKELDSRKFHDASTQYSSPDNDHHSKKFSSTGTGREISPGRAVPQLKVNGHNGSPPPADPLAADDGLSSYTTETYPDDMDFDREWSNSPSASTSRQTRKHRKRVTFDLNAARKAATPEMQKMKQELNSDSDDIQSQNLAQAVVDLSSENDQLRRTISELERLLNKQEGNKIAELEEKAENAQKEGKNQALKARAAAQARIRELEMKLLEVKVNSSKEIENLKAATEVLKSSREWALLENQRLTEQITMGKTKLEDLRNELDSSMTATTYYREKWEAEECRNENLAIELKTTLSNLKQLADEREFYQNEIGQLKEAMAAQDEFVSMLEGDLIVYEAHVGILRESLGASKKEDQQRIRSKAFNAKLNALELEKKEIAKRNNDERIRTKALNVKIRMLEEERDQLVLRLQQYEGESGRNLGDSLASTDDELMHDTKPTFDERAALDVGLEDSTISDANLPSSSFKQPKIEIPDVEEGDQQMQPPPSSQSTIQTAHYLQDIEADSQTILNEDSQELGIEVERLRDQQTEVIAILNHFMQEICEHLRSHSQKNLAHQLENDLRTYQISPELDLLVVITQFRRFIDEVINSLVYDASTLKIEKEAIHEQYELTRFALHEAEKVKRDVEEARLQMEANKKRIDFDWLQLKNSLLIQSQFSNEQQQRTGSEQDLPNVFGGVEPLEQQQPLSPISKTSSEDVHKTGRSSSAKLKLRQEISRLQADNSQIVEEHSQTLSQLNNVQHQNAELDQQVESLRSELNHLRVENQLSRNCLEDLRANNTMMMEERDEMERKIAHLQSENLQVTNEHTQALGQLTNSQQQNGQLDQLVDSLRSELERIKIEAELSRNCLEDLRNNTNWQNQQIVRPQAQQPPPVQSLQNRLPLQQAPSSAFIPVERAVENILQQQRANEQQFVPIEQQQPGPSHQIDQNDVTILGDLTRASQRVTNYLQSQSERLSNSPVIRQQIPSSNVDSQTDSNPLQDSLTQTDHHVDESRERIAWLEEMVNQKDMAISSLMGERDHLNQLYAELRNAYENLQIEFGGVREALERKDNEHRLSIQQQNIESENFRASINELQQNINQLMIERDTLQNELANQRHLFDAEIARRDSTLQQHSSLNDSQNVQLQEEISHLRHQIVQLSAESKYNAQLANERDYFRQQLDELHAKHEHEMELIKHETKREESLPVQSHSPHINLNIDFSQQFDTLNPTIEQFTQTDSSGRLVESRDTIAQPQAFLEVALNRGKLPQFSTAAMTRVVQEQKEILKACIEESVQMENYMSTGVDHLMTLNAELEQCAESIKAQLYALNQQIALELSEQTQEITQNLASSQLASNEQVEELRAELVATRSENEENLRRIDQFQSTHLTLQRTYDELIEKYATLQQSFEDLQQASSSKAETEEKSTDALLDGSTIDQMVELNSTIEEMSVASTEARHQLNEYQQRLQSLQLLMSTQLNSTQDKLRELRSDEFVALKSSVVASISEFKMYLLHSFGQLQAALETTRSGELKSATTPDENSMRRELENTERISRALILCSKICNDLEEDSKQVNEHASSAECLETMLHKIHNHWRKKQEELAEKARALSEQRNLSEMLEGRLNEAETQLNLLQGRTVDSNLNSSSLLSASSNSDQSSNLHMAILAARLTTKQADNDALFKCNAELAKTNVDLHSQVEHLQDCVQRVSEELDAVTNSMSSNSRQSSLASLSIRQDDHQERSPSFSSSRRRVESEESREQLPIVDEDLNEPIETTVDAELNYRRSNDESTQINVRVNSSASSTSTVPLPKKKSTKKLASKKVEKKEEEKPIPQTIEENAWGKSSESPVQQEESTQDDSWGWGEKSASPQPTSNEPEEDAWGWNDDSENQVVEKPPTPQSTPSKSKKIIQKTPSPQPKQQEWGWNNGEASESPEPISSNKLEEDAWGWNDDSEEQVVEKPLTPQPSPSKAKKNVQKTPSPKPKQQQWEWNNDENEQQQEPSDEENNWDAW